MKKMALFFLVLGVFHARGLIGQANQQLWIDVFPHYEMTERWESYGDLGYRTILQDRLWSRFYARPSFRYDIKPWLELHLGLGLFYIWNAEEFNRFEITPWQGLQATWPRTRRFRFMTLFRVEERTSIATNDGSTSFDVRFRLRGLGRLLLCRDCGPKYWFIEFYGEGFWPATGDLVEIFQNRGRTGLGFGYNPSREWRFTFLFNWQSSRSGTEEDFQVSDYVYQLKIRKWWKKREKKVKKRLED